MDTTQKKLPYKKPILKKHASFVDITLGAGGSGFDFGSQKLN